MSTLKRFFTFLSLASALLGWAGAADAVTVTRSAATCIEDGSIGTRTWSNDGSAAGSDDARATASITAAGQITRYLKCTGYDFSIPSTATIDKITVNVERSVSSNALVAADNAVRLVKADVIDNSLNLANASTFNNTTDIIDSNHTSTTYDWSGNWTPEDINNANFGVAYSAAAQSVSGNRTVRVDNISITVDYTVPPVGISLGEWRFNQTPASIVADGVIDSSAYGRNGAAVNGVTTSGDSPRAIDGSPGTCQYGVFNGGNYVALPSFPNLTDNFTITAWIRTTRRDANIHQRIFIDDQSNDGGYGFSLGDPGAGRLRFFSRGPGGSDANISLDTSDVIVINTWYFIAAVADINNRRKTIYVYNQSGGLVTSVTGTYTGNWGIDSGVASIGGELNGTSETSYRFYGNLDEVTVHAGALTQAQVNAVRQRTRPCLNDAPDHIRIEHDGSGLTCTPETLTVKACDNSDCTALFTTVAVSGNITWSGAPGGSVPFNIASGGATTVNLPVTTPQTVTLGASGVNPAPTSTTVCVRTSDSALTCSLPFADSGFQVSAPNHVAETAQTLTIAAVRKADNAKLCVPAFQNKTRTVNLKCGYANPTTGFVPVRLAGTALNAGNNAAASCDATGRDINLTFDNTGAATPAMLYADVGQMNLTATYIGNAGTGDAGLVMTGSGSFIARPKDFLLSGIQQTAAPQLVNPGAPDANGAKFVKAGEPFSVTVTARNALNNATRNFGRETPAEGVKLTPTLVAPSGGVNPALAGSFGAFSNGVASGSGFSWGEAGIITLTPEIAPQGSESVGDYLGAGNVVGTASGNVGRFYPDHFTLSNLTLTNRNGAACNPDSTFTYMGEPLGAAFKLTAKNAGNTVTRNYRGSFAKLDLAVPANFNVGALDSFSSSTAFAVTGITQANPGVVTTSAAHGYSSGDVVFIGEVRGMNEVNGKAYAVTVLGTTTFALQGVNTAGYGAYAGGGVARKKATAGTDLSARVSALASSGTWSAVSGAEGETSNLNLSFGFNRAANPDGPLALEFGLAPADPDGVLVAPYDMDFPPTAGTFERASIGYAQLLFGRLRLSNAHGSERLNLPIPLSAEYYNGAAFVTNVMDNCTAVGANSVLLSNQRPGITTTNMPANNFAIGGAFRNGVGNLRVLRPTSAPSSRGSVDVCLDLDSPTAAAPDATCAATARANLPWLQGNWQAGGYGFDPRARATFGVYKNPSNFIYIREMY